MTVDTATTPQTSSFATDATARQPPASTSHRHDGGYRDTIESILIAFILAFIFRAFVVEAFVIPTGSMAPTLLGAHARFTCDDCGYQFAHNYSAPGGGDDQSIPAEVPHRAFPQGSMPERERHVDCPNCGHVVHDPNDSRNNAVPIHYGDRILVLKYAYLLRDPKRWDVVVFKSPDDPDSRDADTDPAAPNDYGKSWYTTNFIKRLVGRPNEALMVLDGDVYVSETGKAGEFKVQGKPRHVQDALWRIVCDADFIPRRTDRDEDWQPWEVIDGGGWDVGTPAKPARVYTFDAAGAAAGGASSGTIRFDPEFNRERAMTDFLAYAQSDSGHHNVTDLKLSFHYDRKAGDGPLRVAVSKLDDLFTVELTPGTAKLFRKRLARGGSAAAASNELGEEIASATGLGALGRSGPIQIEFMNVDYGVTLRVAGRDVLHAAYAPDIPRLKDTAAARRDAPKPEIRITAADQSAALSHLSLWRDVYYTITPSQWGYFNEPIQLGPDEYFVMGDNTVISQDARYWKTPVSLDAEDLHVEAGRVPKRFMLGKAFFVYWPAGYRPLDQNTLPGVIPNFGDMRFIH